MIDRKLVSVVTGTWQRHDLLMEAIENVRQQTYRPLEHVIVSDGEDDALAALIYDVDRRHRAETIDAYAGNDSDYVPIRFVELGRNWSSYLYNSMSAAPFMVAQFLARGDYQCWMADDERFTPDHIESLVDLLESTDSDFVYPRMECHWIGTPERPFVIGTDPPTSGQITHALYRTELLDYRMFELHVGSSTDWDQVNHWMKAGARWAMLNRVTFTHRVDKAGDGDAPRERQPLRGHTPCP